MADLTKEKIVKINTTGAEKNVKTLKQQIRELKDQLGQLENGTVEYDTVAKKLADTNQKQIQINEAMRYSNKDLGATLSSLTKVSAGVIGAISGINSVMVLMGADSEEAQEAMKQIQALMALIQGLGAIDTATKALKGLTVAFKDFNTQRGISTAETLGSAGAMGAESGALLQNTKKMKDNNEEARTFNELNEKGTEATKKSREEIDKETMSILARAEAQRGGIKAVEKFRVELEKTTKAQNEITKRGVDSAKAIVEGDMVDQIEMLSKMSGAHPENKKIAAALNETKAMFGKFKQGLIEDADLLDMAMNKMAVDMKDTINGVLEDLSPMQIESFMEQVALAMSPEQITAHLNKIKQESGEIIKQFYSMYPPNMVEESEELTEALHHQTEAYNRQYNVLNRTLLIKGELSKQENQQRKDLLEAKEAEDAETASIEANNAAKKDNAKSTEELADAEKKLADEAKKTVPIHKTVWETIKKGWKGLITFIKANPVFAAITGVVGAFVATWKTIDHYVAKAKEEYRKIAEYQLQINTETETQRVEMESLLRMYTAENTSMKEKEVLAKEINKLANDEIIARNKVTGELEINSEKLREYNLNLRNSIELEYHKAQIQDLLAKEEEARKNALNERTKAIGKLFRTENHYLKEAAELVAEQEKHWREIEKLTAGTVSSLAKQQTKTSTPKNSGVVKAFKDIVKEIRELIRNVIGEIFDLKELKMRYNGVYTETEMLLDKINKAVETKGIGEMLSKQFNAALKDGKMRNYGITFDFIFDKESVKRFEKELQNEKDKLQQLLKSKSGASVLDKEVQAQKAVVDEYNKRIAAMKELADAVQAYADAWDKITKTQKEYAEQEIRINRELKTEREYQEKRSGSDKNAESEKSVKLAELQLKYTKQQFEEDKKHRDLLKEKADANQQNQKVYEDYLEYQQKTLESEKAWYDAMTALDNEYYNQRQDKIQQLYDKYEKESEEAITDMSKRNKFRTDYNTDVLNLETQRTYLERLKEKIVDYYNEQLELHKDNAHQTYLIQEEMNAAMLQLQEEQAKKQIEIDEATMRRRAEIAQTYVNLYQNLSSQIGSLIGAEMEQYDESSARYKKLRYMQGVVDVGSGTLAAFMSGIESGVPWPGNLITAFAMAGLTFATGLQQLQNIKNGTLGNAPAATTINFGNYDTLAYAQNSEILANIKDQKVWVSMMDIQDTGRRVEVLETQATF